MILVIWLSCYFSVSSPAVFHRFTVPYILCFPLSWILLLFCWSAANKSNQKLFVCSRKEAQVVIFLPPCPSVSMPFLFTSRISSSLHSRWLLMPPEAGLAATASSCVAQGPSAHPSLWQWLWNHIETVNASFPGQLVTHSMCIRQVLVWIYQLAVPWKPAVEAIIKGNHPLIYHWGTSRFLWSQVAQSQAWLKELEIQKVPVAFY